MAQHEQLIRYIAVIVLIALPSLTLGAIKRDSMCSIVREALKDALYICCGMIGLAVVSHVICIFK